MSRKIKCIRTLYDDWYIISHFRINEICNVKHVLNGFDVHLNFNFSIHKPTGVTVIRVYGNHETVYVKLEDNCKDNDNCKDKDIILSIDDRKKLIREKLEKINIL